MKRVNPSRKKRYKNIFTKALKIADDFDDYVSNAPPSGVPSTVHLKNEYLITGDEPEYTGDGYPLIQAAIETLKREDRIIYYLKIWRIAMLQRIIENAEAYVRHGKMPAYDREWLNEKIEETYNLRNKYFKDFPSANPNNDETWIHFDDIEEVMGAAEHYIPNAELNHYHSVLEYQWSDQDPGDLVTALEQREQSEIRKKGLQGKIVVAGKEFLRLSKTPKKSSDPPGFKWVFIDQRTCELEGRAMGHCGNMGGSEDDTILSLREEFIGRDPVKRKAVLKEEPRLTFILNNGVLGEMKGQFNSRPDRKYHKYIRPLLLDDRIKFIVGGGYAPQNNFSLRHLSNTERHHINSEKPWINSISAYYDKFGYGPTISLLEGMGITVKLKLKNKKYSLDLDEKNKLIKIGPFGDTLELLEYFESIDIDPGNFYHDVKKEHEGGLEFVFDHPVTEEERSQLWNEFRDRYPEKAEKVEDWAHTYYGGITEALLDDDELRFAIDRATTNGYDSGTNSRFYKDLVTTFTHPNLREGVAIEYDEDSPLYKPSFILISLQAFFQGIQSFIDDSTEWESLYGEPNFLSYMLSDPSSDIGVSPFDYDHPSNEIEFDEDFAIDNLDIHLDEEVIPKIDAKD
jgi:hypothetical protein